MSDSQAAPFVVVVMVRETNQVTGVVGPFAGRDQAEKWVDKYINWRTDGYAIAELMPER